MAKTPTPQEFISTYLRTESRDRPSTETAGTLSSVQTGEQAPSRRFSPLRGSSPSPAAAAPVDPLSFEETHRHRPHKKVAAYRPLDAEIPILPTSKGPAAAGLRVIAGKRDFQSDLISNNKGYYGSDWQKSPESGVKIRTVEKSFVPDFLFGGQPQDAILYPVYGYHSATQRSFGSSLYGKEVIAKSEKKS